MCQTQNTPTRKGAINAKNIFNNYDRVLYSNNSIRDNHGSHTRIGHNNTVYSVCDDSVSTVFTVHDGLLI